MMSISCAIIVATSGIYLFYQWNYLKAQRVSDLNSLGEIIAANSEASISFADLLATKETLSTLRFKKFVVYATIYDNSGKVLGYYSRDGTGNSSIGTQNPQQEGTHIIAQQIVQVQKIISKHSKLGTLYIVADTRDLWLAMEKLAGQAAVILVFFLFLALFLSVIFQKYLVDPIVRLVDVMKQVSDKKDYSLRVSGDTQDEVGTLIDGFNEMLAEIQERDTKLEEIYATGGNNNGTGNTHHHDDDFLLDGNIAKILSHRVAFFAMLLCLSHITEILQCKRAVSTKIVRSSVFN